MARKKSEPAAPAHQEPSLVVGLGSSAGGLEALTELLPGIDSESGLALVVVAHLDPSGPSSLTEILKRSTRLAVEQAQEGMRVQAGRVYVIPPNCLMRYAQGYLHLDALRSRHPEAIDVFFRSLAESRGDRAVGVVLSGTGDDGTRGLEVIRCQGGISMAQDPASARFPEMPTSALAAGVDFVLNPTGLAAELNHLAGHPLNGDEYARKHDQTMTRLLALMAKQFGVDFSKYKPTTINRRVLRRMMLHRLDSLESYLALVRQDQNEAERLYQDLLISVTGLFRDPEVFDYLRKSVFPTLLDERQADQTLRIWVPGCSRGDEVYSICICLLDLMSERNLSMPIQVFATDVNERAVEEARQGHFTEAMAETISREHLRRYFVKTSGGYQIAKHIRDLCVFARHDLTRDPPFSRLDLISCRNVLIYLKPELQQRILRVFHYGLRPSGVLVLGSSESLGRAADYFIELDKQFRVFMKRAVSAPLDPEIPMGSSWHDRRDAIRPAGEGSTTATLGEVQREADRVIVSRYAPCGVIVNHNLDVVHFRGRTGPFLEAPPGGVTQYLLSLAREGLLADLRLALQEAIDTGNPSRRERVRVRTNGGYLEMALEVLPLRSAATQGHLLVVFEARGEEIPAAGLPPGEEASMVDGAEVLRLREELEATREYLNAINQQQAATNEDLKAAYEEIQSANEELQSTNEELETAKEELQSTNEELTTLNEELYDRNLELTRSNNDLNNLLASVSMPVIILGPDLRIRRFTPMAQRVLSLIPGDVGRQLGDLRLSLEVPDLQQRIVEVLESLQSQEVELRDRGGHWHSVRIRPYRTAENQIDGAVVVFVDSDRLKRSLDQSQSFQLLAQVVLDRLSEPTAVMDADFTLRLANQRFREELGIALDSEPTPLVQLPGKWDENELRGALKKALEGADGVSVGLGAKRGPRLAIERFEVEGARPLLLLSLQSGTSRRK